MAELTAREQLMLEMVNRARLDPGAEAARLGIALNAGLAAGSITGAAKQVLAPNELLKDSALGHSTWMLANDVFSHTGVGASSPGTRMTTAGYSFTGSWTWGENIAWVGTTGTPDADADTARLANNLFLSPGHRLNILNGSFSELGTGVASGVFTSGGTNYNATMATQNFAKSGSNVFVTGVAINDLDGDNFYDIGEGRRAISVSVSIGGAAAGSDATAASGGYAIGVAGGSVDAVFSGGGLVSDVNVTVEMGALNAKVDLIGDTRIATSASATLGTGAVDLVLLGVAALNGTGNDADNFIFGNRGANVLSGGLGNDDLTGGAGRDRLTGGDGLDVFHISSRTDSGNSGTLRDVITDFVQGDDTIALDAFDASTRTAGDQNFTWRGTAAFSGHAGQLRYVKYDLAGSASDKTIVFGDLNGDRKADFQIELTGLHSLTAIDFIL